MDETGLSVELTGRNPIMRRQFTIKGKTKQPIKCTGCMVNLEVRIARIPE